ncbi:hypothetical protein HOP50_01g07140 [Chloropicon primus]|uniref:C3H1-type domain-containing protein n=2 Tax=Chloropicon primus TaxID=1764295 RepID=A0A5B8MFV8_9CHLO|nr:hypothetical protein A3770_01p07300 [Chloropicon primus]UPQ97423.1 hypothetical protein HOP50_01g07140 [Chloropicon primus]|eukprot:QDZ18212.1 hypothetical protein A3770_01p07300 [Chloropicon primus]
MDAAESGHVERRRREGKEFPGSLRKCGAPLDECSERTSAAKRCRKAEADPNEPTGQQTDQCLGPQTPCPGRESPRSAGDDGKRNASCSPHAERREVSKSNGKTRGGVRTRTRSFKSHGKVVSYKLPYSSLCAADHRFYVENAAKYWDLSPADQERVNYCGERAAKEAGERAAFFQNLAAQYQERYQQFSAGALEVFRAYVSKRSKEIRKMPKSCSVDGVIALENHRESGNDTEGLLSHERAVCSLGALRILESDRLQDYLPDGNIVGPDLKDNAARETCVGPIENDALAKELCIEHDAAVAITSEALTSLLSLVPENAEARWEVPVKVSQDQDKRIVYVSDPLPEYKVSAKEMLTKVGEEGVRNCVMRSHSKQIGRHKSVALFGEESGCPRTAKAAQVMNEKLLKEGSNLFYSIWTYGSVRLLVRYSYLGLLGGSQGSKYAFPAAKLEYSLHENYEDYTVQEMMRWWWELFLHPNAHLLLAKVDAETERVAQTERMNRGTVHACKGFTFSPEVGAQNFGCILKHVTGLRKEGFYVLSHRRGEVRRVVCLSAGEERGEGGGENKVASVNIGKPRGLLSRDIEFVPPQWIGEIGKNFLQIPGTFPPWVEKKRFFDKKQVRHCKTWADGRRCGKGCPLPHLSASELAQCDNVWSKVKDLFGGRAPHCIQRVPHCFAAAQGQPCPFGGEAQCPYPHLSQRIVQELEKLCQSQ